MELGTTWHHWSINDLIFLRENDIAIDDEMLVESASTPL